MRTIPAFTLIEVLVTIALIGMISAFSVSSLQGLQTGNDLQVTVNTVVKALRSAQINAQAANGDTNWGVRITTGTVTLFKGLSYATRDTAEDVVFATSTSVGVSGATEYVFTKFTGDVAAGATILAHFGSLKQISINAKGTLTY